MKLALYDFIPLPNVRRKCTKHMKRYNVVRKEGVRMIVKGRKQISANSVGKSPKTAFLLVFWFDLVIFYWKVLAVKLKL